MVSLRILELRLPYWSKGLPRWLSGREFACQRRRCRRPRFDSVVGEISGGKKTIHSSILAWEIPWTDKPCWTQLSDWACTYTGGPMVKIPASTAESTCSIPGLWIKIPIPHAGAKSKIKFFLKSFGNLAYYSMCYIRTLSIFLEHLIFIIPLVFKILTHIIYWFYCGFNSSIICILQ